MALALPDTEENPHHGFPSWRVRGGRIFATHPDADHVHVMLDPESIREAVAIDPDACEEKWWGKTLSAVRVTLSKVDADVLGALLSDARVWRARS